MGIVTNTLIKQSHLVTDRSVILGAPDYTSIRWYRSRGGATGPFEACSAAVAEPAKLVFEPVTAALDGKDVIFRLNGTTEIAVIFSGGNPIDLVEVASQISSASLGWTCVVNGTELELTTVTTGTQAALEVVGGEAVPLLGLIIGSVRIGKNQDSSIIGTTTFEYFFSDYQGSPDWWYCVEYKTSTLTSARTVPVPSRPDNGVPVDQLVGCFIRLASLEGKPLACRTVTIHNVAMPNRASDSNLDRTWSVFRNYEERITDATGYAEFHLMRGATIDVNVGGSGFTRRVTLPLSSTAPVDLLDPSLSHEDEFGIQQQQIEFALRTT